MAEKAKKLLKKFSLMHTILYQQEKKVIKMFIQVQTTTEARPADVVVRDERPTMGGISLFS